MCTLRFGGEALDPAALARTAPCKVAAVWRRGEPRLSSKPDGRKHETSGLNIGVSNAEFSDLSGQIADALRFFEVHGDWVRAAMQWPGLDGACLDFAIEARDVVVQCDSFPAALLRCLGDLGVDLEVSRYPIAADE